MTEAQLRTALNLLVDDEVDQIHLNSLRMGEGRSLTIHAGGQLVLNDVVFVDLSVSHLSGLPLARAQTSNGQMSILLMSEIYSVGAVVAA